MKNYEESSENIFSDLGLENSEELKKKTLVEIEMEHVKRKLMECFPGYEAHVVMPKNIGKKSCDELKKIFANHEIVF